jgi:hypothetical protein
MSVVDDLRKLLQDMIAPELRALSVKIDHLDRRVDSIEKQIAELRGEMRAQTDSLRAEMRTGVEYLATHLRLDQRLGRLEEENQRKKDLPEKQ